MSDPAFIVTDIRIYCSFSSGIVHAWKWLTVGVWPVTEVGMGWQDEEFGPSHDGTVGVLLADGSEPKPVYLDSGSGGGSGRYVSEWWVYDGHEYGSGYVSPRAA